MKNSVLTAVRRRVLSSAIYIMMGMKFFLHNLLVKLPYFFYDRKINEKKKMRKTMAK
jgi:hypothetical protein